jgi:hypothetical protein
MEGREMTLIGTCYFIGINRAVRYYRDYGLDRSAVIAKIAAGEVHIGKPPTKEGETLVINIPEGRYFIRGKV